MEKIKKQLLEIEQLCKQKDKTNINVSAKGIYWHLDHSMKVLELSQKAIEKSDPKDYKPKFNWVRTIIFLKGSFPRGKAKAPKIVRPADEIYQRDLQNEITRIKSEINKLPTLSHNNYFDHPVFGHINLKKSIKFLGMHNEHHLKIIREILKS